MKIYPINTGSFKLDGGAMFGVVPKALWNKTNPADENNQIEMVTRCMLIIDGDSKILVDNGYGFKQDEKFYSRFQVKNIPFEESLGAYGLKPDDITDMILTHLHFDHAGGSTKWNDDKTAYELTFRNATYWISKGHFDAAVKGNRREIASWLPENIEPLKKVLLEKERQTVRLIEKEGEILPNVNIRFFYGHTEAQAIPLVNYNGKTVVFTADFLALSAHIPTPFVMGYDIRPLLTMEEKETFMKEAIEKQYILFFEHDPYIECCTVKWGKKGAEIDRTFTIAEV